MGFLSFLVGAIALFMGWHRPFPVWWWIIVGLFIFEYFSVAAVRECVKIYEPKSPYTVAWMIIATIVKITIIGISVWSFFR